MKIKWLLAANCIILFMLVVACSSTEKLDKDNNLQLQEAIKRIEASEFKLNYFKMDYNEYLDEIEELIDQSYLETMNQLIRFGHNDENYTGIDLIDMPKTEWLEHKTYMVEIMSQLGMMNNIDVSIQISDFYALDESDTGYIYTTELKQLKGEPFTHTNKKYELKLIDKTWFISDVAFDNFTYGSDMSEEHIRQQLAELLYQTHNDKPVSYTSELLLSLKED